MIAFNGATFHLVKAALCVFVLLRCLSAREIPRRKIRQRSLISHLFPVEEIYNLGIAIRFLDFYTFPTSSDLASI